MIPDIPNLKLLLQLRAGQLDRSSTEAVKSKITSDQRWQRRWLQVEQSSQSTHSDNSRSSVQRVAAYMDDHLNRQQTVDFESECWTDAALLAEVVAVYDSLHQVSIAGSKHDSAIAVSRRTTRRLIELFPGARATTAVESNGVIQAIIEPQAPETKNTIRQLDASVHGNNGRPPSPFPLITSTDGEKKTKRNQLWIIVTAASLIISVSLAIVYWSSHRPYQTISGETDRPDNQSEVVSNADVADKRLPEQVTPDKTERSPMDQNVANDDITSPPATELAPQEVVPSGDRESIAQFNKNPPHVDTNPTTENVTNTTPDPSERLRYHRKQIYGLVATHDPTSRHWLGILADAETFDARAFHVFSASRLQIGIGDMTEITADENTRFRLNPPGLVDLPSAASLEMVGARPLHLELELETGSVAMRNLNTGSQTTLKLNRSSYVISIHEPDSLLVINWQQDTPSLTVIAGAADIYSVENPDMKRTIAAGQFLELAAAAWPATQAATSVLDWFEKPVTRNAIPRRDLDRLLASERFVSDLESLVQSRNRQQRNWSHVVLAQIEPEDHLIAALNHSDARIRLSATQWLLRIPGNSPIVVPVWRQLATLSEQPEWARTAVRWREPPSSGVAVTATDIPTLLEGLVSPHLSIRQISAVVLEQRFGNPAGYQPDAAPAFLEQKRQQWGTWIRQTIPSRPAR